MFLFLLLPSDRERSKFPLIGGNDARDDTFQTRSQLVKEDTQLNGNGNAELLSMFTFG